MVFAQFFSAGPRYDAMLHAVFFGLCLFDDLCARADHIADDHRTGVAVSENFLSPRRFVASIAVFANRWRSFVVAFLATMGWFTERRGDLTFLGQQCACGALGCEYTSHSKKLIPADRAIPENKKLGSYNSYLQQNPKSVSVKESVRRPPLAIQALLPATFVRFSGSILRSFVMQDSFLSRSFPHGS